MIAECRFCFSKKGILISPCFCRGSIQYIHKKCLKKWINKKKEKPKCEICGCYYKIVYFKNSNRKEVYKYLFYVSLILFLGYATVGFLASKISLIFFSTKIDIFISGLVITHIYLYVLYISIHFKKEKGWKLLLKGFFTSPFILHLQLSSEIQKDWHRTPPKIIDILEY